MISRLKKIWLKVTGENSHPTKIKGVTVQCKNCSWWGERGHCGVMPSEVMDGESWCMTTSPAFFFDPTKQGANND